MNLILPDELIYFYLILCSTVYLHLLFVEPFVFEPFVVVVPPVVALTELRLV